MTAVCLKTGFVLYIIPSQCKQGWAWYHESRAYTDRWLWKHNNWEGCYYAVILSTTLVFGVRNWQWSLALLRAHLIAVLFAFHCFSRLHNNAHCRPNSLTCSTSRVAWSKYYHESHSTGHLMRLYQLGRVGTVVIQLSAFTGIRSVDYDRIEFSTISRVTGARWFIASRLHLYEWLCLAHR